jgi:hypothetical protein
MKFTKIIIFLIGLSILSGCNQIENLKYKGIEPLDNKTVKNNELAPTPYIENGNTITAIGSAINKNKIEALKTATELALQNGIQMFIAPFIQDTGNPSLDKMILTENAKNILLDKSSFLEKTDEVSAWNTSTNRAIIKAYILKDKLLAHPIVLNLIKQKLNNPKFAVLLKNNHGKTNSINNFALSTIINRFKHYNLDFVPITNLKKYNTMDFTDIKTISNTIYTETGARYLIISEIEINQPKHANGGVTVSIALTLEVVDTKSQRLITSFSTTEVGNSINIFAAEKVAIIRAIEKGENETDIPNCIYQALIDSLND